MSRRLAPASTGVSSRAVLGVLAAGLLLGGCGGSGPSSNSTASAEQSREQRFVNFAKCLREHGINIPTPTGGGGFKIRFRAPADTPKRSAANSL